MHCLLLGPLGPPAILLFRKQLAGNSLTMPPDAAAPIGEGTFRAALASAVSALDAELDGIEPIGDVTLSAYTRVETCRR